MPDVFVSTDSSKDNDIVMHKRTPLAAPPPSAPDTSVQKGETIVLSQAKEPPVTAPQAQEPAEPEKENQPVQEPFVQEKPAEQFENNPISERPLESISEDQERRNAIPLFTSFWQNPQGVYFDTQEANEHILLFLRRHFITNLPWIAATILFALLPFGIGYLLQLTNYSLSLFPPLFITAVVAMYYLVVATGAFLRFLDWYFNISLITPRRVMDIELKDLVYKKISATKIALVQDVNFNQTGTIRSIFNYGDILVQTAGAQDNFFVNAVPRPEVVVQVMEELIGKGTEDKDAS